MSKSQILGIVAFGLLVTAQALPAGRQDGPISWYNCPDLNEEITKVTGAPVLPFDCAHLSVPLDYTDPKSPPLQLDLFRINATKQPVLGTVLINFGGPGGTGAEQLPLWGDEMAANIGPQWNLVSWDPRGTGKTIPFDCKIDATISPQTSKRDNLVLEPANLTEYYSNGGWEYAKFLADGCYKAMNETGRYVGTASTARDMIEIVDALGEDGLLRYYGWSYGTALGSYVAAMFPDRVERMVLDANVNPHDYQTGTWGAFLGDADKVFSAFLDECLANESECALAEYAKANDTEDMVKAITEWLRPLATKAPNGNQAYFEYETLLQQFFGQLYYPATWPTFAETMTSILNGTASTDTTSAATPKPYNLGGTWAIYGIRASDALWRTESEEEYLPQVLFQASVSSFNFLYTGVWASARWKMDSAVLYDGDFKSHTKHPILYVNGHYDPVTPLMNAYNASISFEDSVVLSHTGYGHGLVVSPSECMSKRIQAYFQNGTMPEPDTVCEPDAGPWEMAKTGAGLPFV